MDMQPARTHTHLRLVAAAHVHHVGELVPPAEPALLLPLVAEAGVPEALVELAAAAPHVHHPGLLVRRAAHRRLPVEPVHAVFLAALGLRGVGSSGASKRASEWQ